MNIFWIVAVSIMATLLVGVGIFLLIKQIKSRKKEVKYDFTNKYGIRVMLSPQTKHFGPEIFDEWSDSVVDFWHHKRGWSKEKCYKMLSQIEVEIYDAEYLERSGIKVCGVMWPSSFLVEITTFPKGTNIKSKERVASLFRHEISHIILGYVGNISAGPGGEFHHKLFIEEGLGA